MKKIVTLFAILACFSAGPAVAQDKDLAVLGAGWFDFNDNVDSVSAQFEWRPGVRYWDYVSPFAGVMLNSDEAIYGFAGLGLDFQWDGFYLYPNFAAGAYGRGDSKDLGHVVEFRSGLELGYAFTSGYQMGVAVHHISNASISSDNPGTEILTFNIGVPFGPAFGPR